MSCTDAPHARKSSCTKSRAHLIKFAISKSISSCSTLQLFNDDLQKKSKNYLQEITASARIVDREYQRALSLLYKVLVM